jgi:hypothetical protein
VGSLLTDPGFVLKPDLYRRRGGGAEERRFSQAREVFPAYPFSSAYFLTVERHPHA